MFITKFIQIEMLFALSLLEKPYVELNYIPGMEDM